MSLAQLLGHCIIYAGGRGSNPGRSSHLSILWVDFLAIRPLDKKKKIGKVNVLINVIISSYVTKYK
jgi:hypothetical protein